MKPQIICLCGSTRFKHEFEIANREATLAGAIVVAPGVFGHADGITLLAEDKNKLDALHLEKIRMADHVWVICPGNYIGESTRREIEFADSIGKPVVMLSENADDDEHPAERPNTMKTCRTCKHWYEQLEGFGTCGNATNHDLLRVLGGYMLCHETYGCVMHKPNAAGQAITRKETPDTQTDEN